MAANSDKKSGSLYPKWSALDLKDFSSDEAYEVFKNSKETEKWINHNEDILKNLQENFKIFYGSLFSALLL